MLDRFSHVQPKSAGAEVWSVVLDGHGRIVKSCVWARRGMRDRSSHGSLAGSFEMPVSTKFFGDSWSEDIPNIFFPKAA